MARRILYLNPLGSVAFDQPIADTIALVKDADSEVEVVSLSLPESTPHVEYRAYQALSYGETVRVAYDAGRRGFDAMIVGCFDDPALKEAREVSGDMVVVALCQASVQVAVTLANRFSIIVGRPKWIEQMTENVRGYGLSHALASMRSIDLGVEQLQSDPKETERRIVAAARRAVLEDHAEAIILGCGGAYGFHEEVQREVGVPVIDSVCAAFKLAEHMAGLKQRLGWVPSRAWSCESPPAQEIAKFGLFRHPPSFANRILVGGTEARPVPRVASVAAV